MKITFNLLLASCILLLVHLGAKAQDANSPILFIYDASGSMWGQLDGKTKKEIAADVFTTAVNKLPDNKKIGLMAYGHREKGNCDDVEQLADIGNSDKAKVIKAVKGLNPLGKTPLARSAKMAFEALKAAKTKATIILITDGIESCDGNICEVVNTAKTEGIVFKLHIVGFGITETGKEQLNCAAEAGGGHYYDAADAGDLGDVLNQATTQTVDDPPGNFSVYAIKNGMPVDAWVKAYIAGTKTEQNAVRTYRDTAYLYLPPGKYEVNIQPLENTNVSGITLAITITEGEPNHQTVSFDGAILDVYTSNNNEGCDALVTLTNVATNTAASGRTYGRNKTLEVSPGMYNIAIKAVSIKGSNTTLEMKNVAFTGGETKKVTHNFETGIAKIGLKTASGELIDASVVITDAKTGESVDAGRTYTSASSNPREFLLSTGTYTVTVKALGKFSGKTETFNITLSAGQTVEKTITY